MPSGNKPSTTDDSNSLLVETSTATMSDVRTNYTTVFIYDKLHIDNAFNTRPAGNLRIPNAMFNCSNTSYQFRHLIHKCQDPRLVEDRKSTRLNSSHVA